jgi:outer membrane lipoprotein-sorting protein
MKKIALILSPVFFLALSLPALAEKISLAELSAYLNGIKTAKATFSQFNDDGSISKGVLFIRRPGAIRFEYAPPDQSLVLAWQGQVAIFDKKSNQPPEKFPLVKTPLNLILAKKVDLGRAKMVVGHFADDTETTIVAQDPKNPEYGSIELVFTSDPVRLRKWVVNDASGQRTMVVLDDLEQGVSFRADLFSIDKEAEKRGI